MLGFSAFVLFTPTAPGEPLFAGFDKVVHIGLFAALAAATAARFHRGLGWVLGYAVASEVLQAVLPIARDGGVWDAVADAAGALVGWGVVSAVAARRNRGT